MSATDLGFLLGSLSTVIILTALVGFFPKLFWRKTEEERKSKEAAWYEGWEARADLGTTLACPDDHNPYGKKPRGKETYE